MSIPIGRHPARGIEAKFGKAGTGTPEIAVLFELTEGAAKGHRITWHGYFSDRAQQRTFEALRYMGWQGDDLLTLNGPLASVADQEVELDCGEEEYDGKLHIKVNWVNRLGGGVALKEEMGADELRKFAASMKSAARGVTGDRRDAPRRDGGAAGGGGTGVDPNDDLPF